MAVCLLPLTQGTHLSLLQESPCSGFCGGHNPLPQLASLLWLIRKSWTVTPKRRELVSKKASNMLNWVTWNTFLLLWVFTENWLFHWELINLNLNSHMEPVATILNGIGLQIHSLKRVKNRNQRAEKNWRDFLITGKILTPRCCGFREMPNTEKRNGIA